MVPTVTSNTPATGRAVGTGDGSTTTTFPVASIVMLQLSLWPFVEDTSAVLAMDEFPAAVILALKDL